MPQALSETTTYSPSESEAASAMRADALRAAAWAGEPFLRADEDPEGVLAPGTARRRALDDARAEIEAGNKTPSSEWKVRYAPPRGGESDPCRRSIQPMRTSPSITLVLLPVRLNVRSANSFIVASLGSASCSLMQHTLP